jgi:hypothetical protein
MEKLNKLLQSLPPSSETGRFLVTTKSGRKFLVEPNFVMSGSSPTRTAKCTVNLMN